MSAGVHHHSGNVGGCAVLCAYLREVKGHGGREVRKKQCGRIGGRRQGSGRGVKGVVRWPDKIEHKNMSVSTSTYHHIFPN